MSSVANAGDFRIYYTAFMSIYRIALRNEVRADCQAFVSIRDGALIFFHFVRGSSRFRYIKTSRPIGKILEELPQHQIKGNLSGVRFTGKNVISEANKLIIIKGDNSSGAWSKIEAIKDAQEEVAALRKLRLISLKPKRLYDNEKIRGQLNSSFYNDSVLATIKSDPQGVLTSVISGIKTSQVKETKKIEASQYVTLENSESWNNYAIAYMIKKDFANAKKILKCMRKMGASDSLTMNNYAVLLLDEMIENGRIAGKTLTQAKELTFKALKFDVRGKGELVEGALKPPFRNLVLIRNIEAEMLLEKNPFASFMLAWIAVEMSVTRIWLQFLKGKQYGNKKRQWFADWDVAFIIEALSMLGRIKPKMKADLDCLRQIRNKVVHGLLPFPEKGQILRCIKLGRELIPL